MPNAFDKYSATETKHKIEALDGAEVTLKELTLKEVKEIANEMIKGMDADGNPIIDFEKANSSQMKKVSMALIEPKMSVADLEGLGRGAKAAIDEIFAIVDPDTAKAIKDAAGKRSSKK